MHLHDHMHVFKSPKQHSVRKKANHSGCGDCFPDHDTWGRIYQWNWIPGKQINKRTHPPHKLLCGYPQSDTFFLHKHYRPQHTHTRSDLCADKVNKGISEETVRVETHRGGGNGWDPVQGQQSHCTVRVLLQRASGFWQAQTGSAGSRANSKPLVLGQNFSWNHKQIIRLDYIQ